MKLADIQPGDVLLYHDAGVERRVHVVGISHPRYQGDTARVRARFVDRHEWDGRPPTPYESWDDFPPGRFSPRDLRPLPEGR